MRRRKFIAGLGGAAAWPLAARAQQSARPIVGVLDSATGDEYTRRLAAVRKGLNLFYRFNFLTDRGRRSRRARLRRGDRPNPRHQRFSRRPAGVARRSRASEIRLVRSRDVRLAAEFEAVFRADRFRPRDFAAHISQRRGPGRREDVFIVDRDMDLQVLAAIVAVDGSRRSSGLPILFEAAVQAVLRLDVILVVETVGIKVDRPYAMIDLFGTPYSEKLRLVERYQSRRRRRASPFRVASDSCGSFGIHDPVRR